MVELSARVLRDRQGAIRMNWGFQFALWCAILWATCYIGVGQLLRGDSFMGMPFAQRDPVISAVVFSILMILFITVICVAWMAVIGRMGEYVALLKSHGRENALYLACAAMGCVAEPLIYYLAFMFDSAFTTAMTMFYPIIGAIVAALWFGERVPRLCRIGLGFMLVGSLILYFPQSLSANVGEFFKFALAGFYVGASWALEGDLSSRAQDTTDSSVGVAVRYTYECAIWIAVMLVAAVAMPQAHLAQHVVRVAASPDALFVLLLAGCLTFDYFGWYKSFALCGVSSGLAVSDVSGVVAVVVGIIATFAMPSWGTVIACAIMMASVIVVFAGSREVSGVLRDVDLAVCTETLDCRSDDGLSLKARVLASIAQRGTAWDWELADDAAAAARHRPGRVRNQVRTACIEAAAAGMIVPVGESVDDGGRFAEGKLLTCYALTQFGRERLRQCGIVLEGGAR